ncbi:MAG: AIR synthase-related protein, partial [Chloroflexota bacterium]
ETSDRSGTGMLIDLDAVPRREQDMAAFEILISESQERMLAVIRPDREAVVREVCERWGLPCAVIGRVTAEPDIRIIAGGLVGDPAADGGLAPAAGSVDLARIPARALTSDAIVHARVATAPTRSRAAPAPGAPAEPIDRLPERGMDPGAVLMALLGSPNLSSRRPVYEQYDSTVQVNTMRGPGQGAAVLRVKGTTKGLVASTDANAMVGTIDPWLGAALSVAEATRNVSITGARPLGVTNCLNFGDPTRPEAFWQLSEAVRGLGDACRALGLPVTGGNVSLYNESPGGAILPTPEIGVVGLIEDASTAVGPTFQSLGDVILLVGEVGPGLAGSAYAQLAGVAVEDDPPGIDLDAEKRLQAWIREAVARGLVASAQDVSGGGLAVALAESAMWGGQGARVRLGVGHSPAVDLFGESPSRLVVSTVPRHAPALELLARQFGLPTAVLGEVGGDRLVVELAAAGATGASEERGSRVADPIDISMAQLIQAWDHGLARALGWESAAAAAEGR